MGRLTLKTDDGLALTMAKDGGVQAVAMKGKRIPLAGSGGFSIKESIVPQGRMRNLGPVTGIVKPVGKSLRFEGALPKAGLTMNARIRAGEYIEVAGEVQDETGLDRALNVTFTVPMDLLGWQWENTAFTARQIEKGRTYPSRKSDFIYLGIKGDGFEDEIPDVLPIKTNKLPFSCVSKGAAGLALGLPIDEPRVFLITADENGYHITFSLGVTPMTKKFPSKASFKLLLYKVDPDWGIRSASERYQSFFSRMYRVRLNKHGNCASMMKANPPKANLKDIGIAFQENDYQWTDGELPESIYKLVKKYNLTAFHWRGPWYWFHEAPGDITRDAQMALLKAQAEGRSKGAHGINNQLCGCPNEISAKAGYNSALINDEGKLERVYYAYPEYSCWLLPMNMDPNLPKPNRGSLAVDWQYRYRKLWKRKSFRGPRGVSYDALDDFSGHRRLNFRRDHIEVMEIPATFDPESGRVCQVKGFGDWAWARMHGKLVHDDGGKIMVNCNLEYAMMFCCPYVDVVFRERRLADNDEEKLSVHRMLLGAKPVSFIGGGREPSHPKKWDHMAERALLFGMSPGETSNHVGLKRITPVFRKIASAGWQSVPYARAKGLCVERFGKKPGSLYLSVRNTGKTVCQTSLTVDGSKLGLRAGQKVQATELFSKQPVAFKMVGKVLKAQVEVDAGRTIVLSLA